MKCDYPTNKFDENKKIGTLRAWVVECGAAVLLFPTRLKVATYKLRTKRHSPSVLDLLTSLKFNIVNAVISERYTGGSGFVLLIFAVFFFYLPEKQATADFCFPSSPWPRS